MQITVPVAKVLAALLAAPDDDHYGLHLIQQTGLASGTLYPVLTRLRNAGWVEAHWEDVDPARAGRPARRYYRLTADGHAQAETALTELRAQLPVQPPKLRQARTAW
jgi:DNA-binding PadR family transcriptional regulator